MQALDWIVLIASLLFIVTYGLWKGKGSKNIKDYILANKSLRWPTIAFSIMATQASAITFLSAPGQAYVDGMRFVQYYLGLPIAMVILCITAIPIYHRLNVYTAYEYLEGRFDLKTRLLAALLFLTQRGLAAGLTIFAPAIILSVLFGWNLYLTNLVIGVLVISYTASGGTKAVNHTNFHQMGIIVTGMICAFLMLIYLLPDNISFLEAVKISGKMGRLNVMDFKFDLNNRYNFWSGILGGTFLALSYFGTDQSQVQRYLTGRSVTQSRLGLLFNVLVKIPMQFFILFIAAMVFVFYQFERPPIFFNTYEVEQIQSSQYAEDFSRLEEKFEQSLNVKEEKVESLVQAIRSGNNDRITNAQNELMTAEKDADQIRDAAIGLMKKNNPDVDPIDTNFIFLSFVIEYLPAGLVGLIIAVIFAASMSSTSSELNALASTTIVDIYKRVLKKDGNDRHYLIASKLATVFWGIYAILLAEYASRLGSLIEAVNILGSLFYGTILGIFLVAFYIKSVRGTAVFYAAIAAEALVIYCFMFTDITFLWYNAVGCGGVIIAALILNPFLNGKTHSSA
jgi:Na+/proline symporter